VNNIEQDFYAEFQGKENLINKWSTVFARWRQCAPHLIRVSLGPPEFKSKTASRLVQPFLHGSADSVPIFYNGPLLPPKMPIPTGIWTSI